MKTSELTGAALDWAVAKCEGVKVEQIMGLSLWSSANWKRYSTNWAQGGPIIEREEVDIDYAPTERQWYAHVFTIHDDEILQHFMTKGPTPLIAAMRCYVASKLGDTIDIPEELK